MKKAVTLLAVAGLTMASYDNYGDDFFAAEPHHNHRPARNHTHIRQPLTKSNSHPELNHQLPTMPPKLIGMPNPLAGGKNQTHPVKPVKPIYHPIKTPIRPKPTHPVGKDHPVRPKPKFPVTGTPIRHRPVTGTPIRPKPIDHDHPIRPKPTGPITGTPIRPKPIGCILRPKPHPVDNTKPNPTHEHLKKPVPKPEVMNADDEFFVDNAVYADDDEFFVDDAVYADDDEFFVDNAVYADDDEFFVDEAVYADDDEFFVDEAVYADDDEFFVDEAVYADDDDEYFVDEAVYADDDDEYFVEEAVYADDDDEYFVDEAVYADDDEFYSNKGSTKAVAKKDKNHSKTDKHEVKPHHRKREEKKEHKEERKEKRKEARDHKDTTKDASPKSLFDLAHLLKEGHKDSTHKQKQFLSI